ncbi:MAG: hypothetical protein RIT19_1848 [Verrucomicrobiota bacterium]|jgi:hypothetical protein
MMNGCGKIVNKDTVVLSNWARPIDSMSSTGHSGADTPGIACASFLPQQMSDPMRNTQKHQHEHH